MIALLAAVLLAAPAFAGVSTKVEVYAEGSAPTISPVAGPSPASALSAPVLTPSLAPALSAVPAAMPVPSASPAASAPSDSKIPAETAKAASGARFDLSAPAAEAPEGPEPVAAAATPAKATGLARWKKKISNVVTAPLGLFKRPSNDRNWSPDNAVLPYAEFSGDKVTVRNVRDARYRSKTDYTVAYEDRTYDLRDARKVWYVVEPFGKTGLMAHTFVTFDFKDGRHLSVSVEVRKVVGESYSPFKGLFNNYEIAYVVADERDVAGLRVNHRKSQVYMYPVKAGPDKVRAMLTFMLKRATDLRDKPEFYNTLTNTCLSNIQLALNHVADRNHRIGPHLGTVLPGLSDKLAFKRGLVDTDLPFEQARERYRVNARAAADERSPEFSESLRR